MNTIQKSYYRNYGLDLLKILMMFLVISFHFSDHGMTPLSYKQSLTFNWFILASARKWGGCCNACFMLISGFFMCQKRFKARNIAKLYLQVWFYSVVFGVVCYVLGTEPFDIKGFVKMIFPFIFNQYWYFSMYLVIYLMSPFINVIIQKISREQHKALIIIGILIFSVIPTLTNQNWMTSADDIGIFIIIYLIGAYFSKWDVTVSTKKAWGLVIGTLFLDFASIFGLRLLFSILNTSADSVSYLLWPTSKILPIVTAVAFFLLFKDIRFSDRSTRRKKCIESLSASVFGVYLFHIGRMNVPLFQIIFDNSKTYETGLFLPQMLLAMVSIFTVGIIIDKVRILLFERPVMRALNSEIDKWQERAEKYLPK